MLTQSEGVPSTVQVGQVRADDDEDDGRRSAWTGRWRVLAAPVMKTSVSLAPLSSLTLHPRDAIGSIELASE
jgi:hypothetical protein